MFCPKCGKSIPADSAFCLYCGAVIPKIVPAAENEMPPDEDLIEKDYPVRDQSVETDFVMPHLFDDLPEDALQPQMADDDTVVHLEDFFPPSAKKMSAAEKEAVWPDVDPDDMELPGLDDLPLKRFEPAAPAAADHERTCSVCGRELPEGYESDICVTCTYNRSFVASPMEERDTKEPFHLHLDFDLDEEYPDPPAEKTARKRRPPAAQRAKIDLRKIPPRRLLVLAGMGLAALVILVGIVLLVRALLPKDNQNPQQAQSSSNTASPTVSNQEKKAVAYAQEMVRDAAYAPDSVTFDAESLEAHQTEDGRWTVSQQFDRRVKTGETVTAIYTALLQVDRTQEKGYQPLRLQVDDAVLYDYTAQEPAV